MSGTYDLQRFVDAQQHTYAQALTELKAGQKQTHWMWFIFPQIAGLGHSSMAQRYAIDNLGEATAYLRHPLLAPRLDACCQALLQHRDRSARQILGSPDDLKLCSSMTLFNAADPRHPAFRQVLEIFFSGMADAETLKRLG